MQRVREIANNAIETYPVIFENWRLLAANLPCYGALFCTPMQFPLYQQDSWNFPQQKTCEKILHFPTSPNNVAALAQNWKKNIVVGKKFGWTGPRAVIYRPGGFLREWRPRQKRRLARMKKSGASPSVILDRTILMWLSFYRGRRRPGDIKKESFFQPQPFFLAAKAAKRSLWIHTHLNIWIFCSCKYRIPTK